MDSSRFAQIFHRYLTNQCSPSEFEELLAQLEQDNSIAKSFIEEHLTRPLPQGYLTKPELKQKLELRLKKILQQKETPVVSIQKKRLPFQLVRVAAAAVIFFAIATIAYFMFFNKGKDDIAKTKSTIQNDVAPGGNKALLILADGSKIVLDSAANGAIAQQGNTKIIKLDSGQLAYNGQSIKAGTEVEYNTLATPKGGQYQVTLPDGTKVWLSTASSLRYPTVFGGKERNVELSGEAYFEVAHNAAMPFHVKVNDMTVEVLGTHFNVMAYDDEAAVKTTLLEGAVKVVSAQSAEINLIPGQQAQLNKKGELKLVKDADIEEAVAWRNGLFYFNKTDIETVMRQIQRWYNVDVSYEGNLSGKTFSGQISKYSNASKVLELLEETGDVHFRIEKDRIVVSP